MRSRHRFCEMVRCENPMCSYRVDLDCDDYVEVREGVAHRACAEEMNEDSKQKEEEASGERN